MPIYTYKGYDSRTGATRKGKTEADSPKAARAKLRKAEKVIVSELKEEASLDKVKGGKGFSLQQKVGLADIAIMSRQFATLQSAHVPLDETLSALTAQVENVMLRNTLSAVKDQVSEGKSLGEAASKYPGVFSRLYVNMIRAGEASGTLGLVMERLADYTEKQVEAKGQIVAAMAYPAIMMLAIVGLIGYMFFSLVPKLQKVFDSLRVTLPWYTKVVIGISEWLQNNYLMVPIIIALIYFGMKYWLSSEQGKLKFDRFVLRMPVFGPLVLRMQVTQFTQTLSTLLSSGVPIIRALEITKNIISNSVIAEVIETAKIAVQEGKDLGSTIAKSGRFPPLVTHMIMTGEKTGQLEDMLTHVSKAYDAEVQRKIGAMISLIEPLMIIFMAGSAGTVMAALLVPMLSIMNQVR